MYQAVSTRFAQKLARYRRQTSSPWDRDRRELPKAAQRHRLFASEVRFDPGYWQRRPSHTDSPDRRLVSYPIHHRKRLVAESIHQCLTPQKVVPWMRQYTLPHPHSTPQERTQSSTDCESNRVQNFPSNYPLQIHRDSFCLVSRHRRDKVFRQRSRCRANKNFLTSAKHMS